MAVIPTSTERAAVELVDVNAQVRARLLDVGAQLLPHAVHVLAELLPHAIHVLAELLPRAIHVLSEFLPHAVHILAELTYFAAEARMRCLHHRPESQRDRDRGGQHGDGSAVEPSRKGELAVALVHGELLGCEDVTLPSQHQPCHKTLPLLLVRNLSTRLPAAKPRVPARIWRGSAAHRWRRSSGAARRASSVSRRAGWKASRRG